MEISNKWYWKRDNRYYSRCCYKVKKAVLKAKNYNLNGRCKQIDENLGYSDESWRTLKSLRMDWKNKIPYLPYTIECDNHVIKITEIQVRNAPNTMKNAWARGPNRICIEMMEDRHELLIQLLTFIFNLHKKYDKKRCSNCRGLEVDLLHL